MLLKQAEGMVKKAASPDLQRELEKANKQVRDEFAPLAFLYNLRNHGGLAHLPSKEKVEAEASKLGSPKVSWQRTDYLRLLKLVAESVGRISEHLDAAAQVARH